jgi:hypothetical protein
MDNLDIKNIKTKEDYYNALKNATQQVKELSKILLSDDYQIFLKHRMLEAGMFEELKILDEQFSIGRDSFKVMLDAANNRLELLENSLQKDEDNI